MERRRLGATGLLVPVIGVGTWGTFDTSADVRPLVDEALAAGADLFDTSRLYRTVDVYQVHNLVNVPAHLPLLEGLRAEGLVRAVGATHYREEALGELAALMRAGRLEMVQIPD